MYLDPLFLAVAIPAVLLIGISKGGFGAAFGFVAVPLMALVIPPVQAAAIMLPILCVMDIFGLTAYRRIADFRNLLIMVPGALIGIALGTLTFRYLQDDAIRLIIGAIVIGFLVQQWVRKPPAGGVGRSVAKGTVWATVSGFTSFVAHAGSPPVQIYLLPQKLDKTIYTGTTVWLFFIVNYAKLIPYGYLGLWSTDNLATSAALLPLAPLGIWLGVRLHRIVSDAVFYGIVRVFLLVSGLKLGWDGLTGLGWL